MDGERLHQTKYRQQKGEWAWRLFVVAEGDAYAVYREEVDRRRKPVNYRRVGACPTLQEAIDTAEAN